MMKAPTFGFIYFVAALSCLFWGNRTRGTRLLSLTVLLLAVAGWNAYIENWTVFDNMRREKVEFLLTVVFLGGYTQLSISLMRQLTIKSGRVAFFYSYLPVVYAFILAIAAALPRLGTLESPRLAFYIFVVVICALHVPMFAAGKSQAQKVCVESLPLLQAGEQLVPILSLLDTSLVLGVPLLITLVIQMAARDDWRLFASNATLSAAIVCLVWISRTSDRNEDR